MSNPIIYPHGYELSKNYTDYSDLAQAVTTNFFFTNVAMENEFRSATQNFLKENFKDNPTKLDTSIGGNYVINPYPGGDPDDDFIFPLNSIDNYGLKGLGHKYNEVIQSTQKILWFSFGIPKFNNLEAFYDLNTNSDGENSSNYANVVTQGSDENADNFFGSTIGGFASFIGKVGKTAGKLAIRLPFAPIRSYKWMTDTFLNDTITKYYDFEPAMVQYYKLANSIIGILAVSMNLYGNDDAPEASLSKDNQTMLISGSDTSAEFIALESDDKTNYVEVKKETNDNTSFLNAIPEILKNGPDLYTILDKRRRYNSTDKKIRNLDSLSEIDNNSFKWKEALTNSMSGGDQFIGFRIEKGTDTSETISNTTGEAEIAGILNSVSEKMRSTQFSLMGVNLSDMSASGADGFFSTLSGGVQGVVDFIKSAIGSFDFGQSTSLFTGNGYFDIPEVWKNSSFTKSYTFSIELESRLGDPVSIYQNIYIPLACLLAAACPRAVGKNMYTAPFILQAYVQGMFAIPLGIIDNITLRRGSSDYGWSYDGLPTSISVNFSIKDLSPAMFLSLYGEGFVNIFAANSSMHEYLATLSGLDLAERKRFGKRFMKRWNAALALHRTTTFNPIFWSNKFGNSRFLRNIGTVFMDNKWPTN